MTRHMSQQGFSLLELLLVVSISSILLLVVGNFAANGMLSSNADYHQTLVLSNAKEAVMTVARRIESAKSVEATNSQPDANAPGAPGNLYSWSGAAGNGAALILAVPSKDAGGNLIYSDGLHNNLYTDNMVFYLDPSTRRLYRRLIANASAPGNAAKTTCPPDLATPACPPDADVIDDVANLTTSYLDQNGNPISVPSGTEAVTFTVTESRLISGRTYSGTYTTTATLRNK